MVKAETQNRKKHYGFTKEVTMGKLFFYERLFLAVNTLRFLHQKALNFVNLELYKIKNETSVYY